LKVRYSNQADRRKDHAMISNHPGALEDFVRDRLQRRREEVARDALARQLHTPTYHGYAAALRRRAADGLRALACRLDPTIVCEPALRVALPR
jgi:hypothetical protein